MHVMNSKSFFRWMRYSIINSGKGGGGLYPKCPIKVVVGSAIVVFYLELVFSVNNAYTH